MRYAVIDQPVPGSSPVGVVSVVETDGDPPAVQPGQGVVCDPPDGVVAGWVFVGGRFWATAPGQDVPDIISDRQCFQQLATLGLISQDEALAAVTVGALPKVITDGIAGLPDAQQFPARMMLCGATQFQRLHPMTPVLGSFLGLDASGLDALWRAGALL